MKNPRLTLIALSLLATTGCVDDPASQDAAVTDGEQFVEIIRDDEEAEFEQFAERIQKVQKAHAAKNGGAIKRGFHAKQHACIRGEFEVNEDVPDNAGYGLFASAAKYPAWVRFSNGQGTSGKDKNRDVRGLAVKVVGVEGEKLLEEEPNALTQDFLLTNRRASHVDDAAQFMEFAEATTSTASMTWYLLKHPKVASRLISGIRKDVASLTTETYWSGSPYKLGPRAVKYAFAPCDGYDGGSEKPDTDNPDYLSIDLKERLAEGDVCFDFMVQFQTNGEDMPIEKASVVWDEEDSPFVSVGKLRIAQRDLDDAENADSIAAEQAYCEKLSFTPWHSLPEHRPLGHMNRARKFVYQASAEQRSADGIIAEPDGSEPF